MLKVTVAFLSLIISTSAFATNESYIQERIDAQIKKEGRQDRLQMRAGMMNRTKKSAEKDGDFVVVAYCEDQMQAVVNGGCNIIGPISKQEGSTTTYSKSEGLLQSFSPSFSSWLGVETYVCHYKNVKKGDLVTASATCK